MIVRSRYEIQFSIHQSVLTYMFLSNWYQSKIKKEKGKAAANEKKVVIDCVFFFF